jgi:glycosyltransferase involved in cell wall biosynthesis
MSDPEITVLLTVYNGMPYLPEAVDGILAQTRRDFVFLVLDNGSGDNTGIYLNSLSDPRLKIVHLEKTLPRTEVLNKALEMVETPVIAVIDADDLAEPDRLELQSRFLETHPDVALVGCNVRYVDPQGKTVGTDEFPEDHASLMARMPLFNQFAHAGCMYRTEAALAVGGYPSSSPYAQDQALWLAMFRAGYKAAGIPKTLAGIRVHPGQQTRSAALIRARAEDDARLAAAMLDIPGLPAASRQAARLRRAAALWRLGSKPECLSALWAAIKESPLLLPVNPLLWQRLFLQLKRLIRRAI